MKTEIYRINGKICRVKTDRNETVYGKGLTDWEYILLNRIYRKYRKLSFEPPDIQKVLY